MKMKFGIIFQFAVIILLFSLYGCNSREKEKFVGDINPLDPVIIDVTKIKETNTPLKLTQFAESISYINLSEDPLIGYFKMSPIRVFEDTIYIDINNIYKYTPDGKFIKKLFKEGQGPEEALKYEFQHSAFNERERYLTFATIHFDYMSYSFDGNFLGKSEFMIDSATSKGIKTYFNGYRIYVKDHYIEEKGNRLGTNLFYVEDIRADSVFYFYPNPAANDTPPYYGTLDVSNSDMNFIHIDSTLWFKHHVLDTLYSTQDFATILPRYIFKTDNRYMNIHEYIEAKNLVLSRDRYMAKIITGVLPLPIGGLLFTIDEKLTFADRTGKVSDYTGKLVINDIDKNLKEIDIAKHINTRTFSVYNNCLYILVDAPQFFEDGCKPPFSGLTEDSNPVVVKIKLKTR